jgi:hypothetical protein
MPRHRKAPPPRHRALPRVEDSIRRVPLSAAIAAARQALEATRPLDAASGQPAAGGPGGIGESGRPATELDLQEPGVASDRPDQTASPSAGAPRRRRDQVRPGGPSRPAGRPDGIRGVARGAARSLLVTPWFAAGGGFVLAAALFIFAPHTELRFPSAISPAEIQCTTLECRPASHNGGQLTSSGPGQQIKRRHTVHRRTLPGVVTGHESASAGFTFTFTVLWQRDGNFDAVISISGRRVPASWRLAFSMPGTQIGRVFGAQWRASESGDAGTASAWPNAGHDHGQGWGGGGGSNQGAAGRNPGYGHDGRLSFWVTGSGQASTPATCVFDGASCSFS